MSRGTRERGVPERYTFFNPKLRDAFYATGDIYDAETLKRERQEWEEDRSGPYLTHIKNISNAWPHLRYLADFMEVGTSTLRWPSLKGKENREKHQERLRRTNVTRIDYYKSGNIEPKQYTSSKDLRTVLEGEAEEPDDENRQLRLFIVEDLSRDVIELLGAHFDIEPTFFREHIVDYAWYNVRDRWINHPALNATTKQQRWVQLRFVTARYFQTKSSFKEGFNQAEQFNILRRPDDDQNNIRAIWDNENAVVGLTRTRASFWMKSGGSKKYNAVGVMLVDPTISEGSPLWYGYRNWEATPSIHDPSTPVGPPRDSLYKDLVYWAQKPEAFRYLLSDKDFPNVHLPIQALLHLVGGEWLVICDYIKSRLGQIEWEISYPEHFLGKGGSIDLALKKLHVWRRLVPLYREMLDETLQRVFYFPCNGGDSIEAKITGGQVGENDDANSGNRDTANISNQGHPGRSVSRTSGPISPLNADFSQVRSYMEEYQQRIDRLTSVVTAIISIGDSRRGQEDNRNVNQLTWLATFFIPLSYISSLFSMQSDLSGMGHTWWVYFAAAIPLSVVCLGVARFLTHHRVQAYLQRIIGGGSTV